RFTIFRSGETVVSGSTKELDEKKFTYYMTGREFEDTPFVPGFLSDAPVLEARALTMRGHFADVSFHLNKGEFLGITGLLDSGRTELALALFGARPVDSGDLKMHGRPIRLKKPADAIEAKIGYVPEDRLSEGLFLPRSIGENIVVSKLKALSGRLSVVNRRAREREIDKWVKQLSIKTPDPNNACLSLSGGNQQRVVLAKWLACAPDVLVLNGPTMGVDIGSKHDIHQILRALATEGMAVVIISDDLPEVLKNCSRVLVMKAGRVVAELDPRESDERALSQLMM
ncbi:MAG: ATP-binding cassette domain-containing protein, partial [Eubacteriales bacterium]|nr:ATP-binding cassette domain-containing protein [Eubacteriales bacterium]